MLSERDVRGPDVTGSAAIPGTCRVCGAPMRVPFVDLGMIPLCQSFATADQRDSGQMFYPLRAEACEACHYVGLTSALPKEDIFTEYAYFSSVSESWLAYVRDSAAALVDEFALDRRSQVVEMASNDGYLLQYFVQRGIPVIGVEPAANVARVANERGVPTLARFFGSETAAALLADGRAADLLLSYNSLDHCADLRDVMRGIALLLKPEGTVQIEVPYLRAMVESSQFDTVYHDRCSYFSFLALHGLFERSGLRAYDVERIPTHGGSLRVRGCHAGAARPTRPSVAALLADERGAGMTSPAYYAEFTRRAAAVKHALLDFLVEARRAGKSVVGYGAPAKGNVLLNYCGIRSDFLDYLVDRNPYKCGKYAPGTQLPVRSVEELRRTRPDYVLILPWNIKDEVMAQAAFIRDWGGRFVVAIPQVEVL